MDKEINVNVKRAKQRSQIYYVLGTVILLGLIFYIIKNVLAPSIYLKDLSVGEVREGEMSNTISAFGTIEPSAETVLISPLSAKIKKLVLENGASVKAGEAILILDTEYSALELERLNDELKLKNNNVVRLKLELEKNIRDLELDDQIKNLQIKNFEGLLSDAKRLKAVGGMTQEEVDKSQQNLNIALLDKKKLENELKYRKESIASSVQNEQIQSAIHKKRIDELAKKLQNSTIKAELPGVITWIDNRIGTQVSEGEVLVKLANISSYGILAQVADMHAEKISVGQNVQVELNNSIEMGEIVQISPAVENNTVQFRIRLKNASSEKLRPKMKVPVRIITDTKQKSIYISNGPGILAGKSQKIFVLENDIAKARSVEFGFRTSDKVEILSGLKPGEKVILSDMSLFENKSQLKVKP